MAWPSQDPGIRLLDSFVLLLVFQVSGWPGHSRGPVRVICHQVVPSMRSATGGIREAAGAASQHTVAAGDLQRVRCSGGKTPRDSSPPPVPHAVRLLPARGPTARSPRPPSPGRSRSPEGRQPRGTHLSGKVFIPPGPPLFHALVSSHTDPHLTCKVFIPVTIDR